MLKETDQQSFHRLGLLRSRYTEYVRKHPGYGWDLETQLACAEMRWECENLLKKAGRRRRIGELGRNRWEDLITRGMKYFILPFFPEKLLWSLLKRESPVDSEDRTEITGELELPGYGMREYRLTTEGHVNPEKSKEILLYFPGFKPGLVLRQNHAVLHKLTILGEYFPYETVEPRQAKVLAERVQRIKAQVT